MNRTRPWPSVILRTLLTPVAVVLILTEKLGEAAAKVYDYLDKTLP